MPWYAAGSGGREMLMQEFSMRDEFALGETEDDFEGVSLDEWKAFEKYLKKSKIRKSKFGMPQPLYPAS